MPFQLTESDIARHEAKIDRRGPNECWPWTAACFSNGYGAFRLGPNQVRAHRVAFYRATGIDPGEQRVCHSCDNPPCCNPAHLWLGTDADNHADREAKGRGRRLHGADNPAAVLTEADIHTIDRLYAEGLTQQAIGDRFGITQSSVKDILHRINWAHVPVEPLPPRQKPPSPAQGEGHGRALLTEAAVLDMRRRYADGSMSRQRLADEYGVHYTTVSDIVRRLSWTHLP